MFYFVSFTNINLVFIKMPIFLVFLTLYFPLKNKRDMTYDEK
jgi:hypothetical protein